jgi:hypothetical protein
MPRFELKQSTKLTLTSHSGLALIGQCCEVAQVEEIVDGKLPTKLKMPTSAIAKSMVGLISLGKSDFEAIEPFREDPYFKDAMGLDKVPSGVWLRQRLDECAAELREVTDEMSLRLLERAQVPITAHQGYVCADIDTFVMNNEGTKKEAVGRTYQGMDGYTPIAAYLGNEGWSIGLELRPGVQHSAKETDYFLARIFPRLERLVAADQPVLLRDDSGFDSVKLLFQKAEERERWIGLGRSFDFITKWNPRKQDRDAWVRHAEEAGTFIEVREGKRVALLDVVMERAHGHQKRAFRLIAQVTERTIDNKGQMLLLPEIELEGWWTSLALPAEEVIALYQHHGMHEQFHSEFKTDLDLERLPSGKFDTNDAIVHLAVFAYNCLRLLGQVGLTGQVSPVRHPAKRRRLKTVLQEVMYRAAKFVRHARQRVLDFGRGVARHVDAFGLIQLRLQAAGSS